MDRALFYAALRSRTSGVFGTKLSEPQVRGLEMLLTVCAEERVTDPHHVAESLAEVYHETGGYMLPIKETVMAHHRDKNPSDKTVIARLDRAFAKGLLKWVKKPYWRDGWFGRGPIQTTHKEGYRRIGQAIGVDLVANRDRILEPRIGALTAVIGMRDGIYTGRKLADFDYERELVKAEEGGRYGPRRIVNGVDGTDKKVAGYHQAFYRSLIAAGYDARRVQAKPAPPSEPEPAEALVTAPTPEPSATAPKEAKTAASGLAVVTGAALAALATWWSDISQWIGGLFQ